MFRVDTHISSDSRRQLPAQILFARVSIFESSKTDLFWKTSLLGATSDGKCELPVSGRPLSAAGVDPNP